MTTVAAALRDAARLLDDVSDTARLDAELLMAEALEMSRSDMLLKASELAVPMGFADLVRRRTQHEPVAYILGRREFYGRDFLVTADVLIPRADSETIVEAALGVCGEQARILDLGTGSGALLLTLLAERPGVSGTGIDSSLGAIAVAASNTARLGVAKRARIFHGDWTMDGWTEGLGRFDLIVANPPYVETNAKLDRSVCEYEPAAALFSGPEGLDDYRIFVPQLRELLCEGGAAVLEIGFAQNAPVAQIARESGFRANVFRDLAGRPRALLLR